MNFQAGAARSIIFKVRWIRGRLTFLRYSLRQKEKLAALSQKHRRMLVAFPTMKALDEREIRAVFRLRRFFNTSGRLYREQHLKDTLPGMTKEEMYALLGSDGMLVKRPNLVGENCVLTGFNEKVWEEKLINGK